MAFCNNCGAELNNQSFCPQCGTKNESFKHSVPENGQRAKKQSGISWKRIVPLSIIAVIVCLMVGAHFYLSSQAKAELVTNEFEKAVKNKDYQSLITIIESGNSDVNLSEADVKQFASFLTESEEDVLKQLKKNAIKADDGDIVKPITDENKNKMITVTQKGKKWLFYNQYVIQVFPTKLKVTANFPNTDVSVGKMIKTKVKKEDEETTIGMILPGSYSIKAAYKGEYDTLEFAGEFTTGEAENNELQVPVEFETDYVGVYSNYEDAILFVNGKNTGKTIEQLDNEIGPISQGGTVTLHAEKKFENVGTLKTDEITSDGIYGSELTFDYEEKAAEEVVEEGYEEDAEEDFYEEDYEDADYDYALEEFMNVYQQNSIAAINERQFSLVSDLIDPLGPSYKEAENYIEYLSEKGITEEAVSMKVISSDLIGDLTFEVVTEEEYVIYYSDGKEKMKSFTSKYHVVATNNGLKMHSLIETNEN